MDLLVAKYGKIKMRLQQKLVKIDSYLPISVLDEASWYLAMGLINSLLWVESCERKPDPFIQFTTNLRKY